MELHFSSKSRAKKVAVVTLLLLALFVARLFYIQVIQHQVYVSQADAEQVKQFTLHAERGQIYALDGNTPVPLVMNEKVYTVWVDPTQVTDKNAIVTALNKIAGGNVRNDFAKYIDMSPTRYQVLATKVSLRQAEMLKKQELAGVGFDAVTQRVYPEGSLASQVLGFVNAEGKGTYGFEQANDADLRGRNGMLKTVTDIRDVPLTVSDKNIRTPAVNGKNMVLTIDRNIQAEAEQALARGAKKSGADKASVIIMDPATGKVMAMANYPTYNPAELNKITDISVLNNNTISHPYEAGSDIKTLTMATGLDKGVVTPKTKWDNTGQVRVEDITINNATKIPLITGNVTMQTALNWSLNTGMVRIAQLLGDGSNITLASRNTIYDYFYNHFRLGRYTGIALANEQKGTIISPSSPDGGAVRYSNMVFGQGMDVTMLQVISGLSAAINGGVYHVPTIIAGTVGEDGTYTQSQPSKSYNNVVKPSTSATLREMVHEAHYATYNPHDGSEAYFIGGKTGTSQTVVDNTYSNTQTVGTYLGFGGATANAPRYAIMVEISAKGKEMGGGTDAKPIFNVLSNWMINYLGLTAK